MLGTRRMRLAIAAVGAIVGAMLWTPTAAHADGGAYIELNQTYYLPGDTAVAKAYVSIPKGQQAILDRGPFDLYLLPRGTFGLREDRPIPAEAIRVGTLSIEREHGTIELKTRFIVPEVSSGSHYVAICNDPCTVAGFKEPLTGWIGVVATAREAHLLKQNGTLRSKTFSLQRNVRKAAKRNEALQTDLQAAEAARSALASTVADLHERLAQADASLAQQAAHQPAPWGAVGLAGTAVLTLVGALILGRRGRRSTVEVAS